MANPIWPSTVPFISNIAGYTEPSPNVGQLVSQMEKGVTKTRNRMTMPIRYLAGRTKRLTSVQLATFQTFYDVELNFGNKPFDAPDCRAGADRTFKFINDHYSIDFRTFNSIILALDLEIRP